jgi:YidC/Oxa1 family membrane protein insertase
MEKEKLDRSIKGGWLAMQQRYFLSSWIPNQEGTYHYFSAAQDKVYTIGLVDNSLQIPAREKMTTGMKLYVGPEIVEDLKPLAKGLDLTIDYGWLWPISITLMWLMKFIYKFIGNWGWAIILLTVLIKAVFYKLSETSCCSMAKMKELAPKVQALKERFGDDRQKLSQATMELYRKEKINPLGGCLPMLVQIPFFIALYYVLIGAVELRQAPFIFWIHDLSVRDPFFVLPVLNGLTMFLQQKLTPSSPDPAQQKMMMLMPLLFTVFFISFPAGLVLYWLVNSGLSVLQQWYITNKIVCKPEKKRVKK